MSPVLIGSLPKGGRQEIAASRFALASVLQLTSRRGLYGQNNTPKGPGVHEEEGAKYGAAYSYKLWYVQFNIK